MVDEVSKPLLLPVDLESFLSLGDFALLQRFDEDEAHNMGFAPTEDPDWGEVDVYGQRWDSDQVTLTVFDGRIVGITCFESALVNGAELIGRPREDLTQVFGSPSSAERCDGQVFALDWSKGPISVDCGADDDGHVAWVALSHIAYLDDD